MTTVALSPPAGIPLVLIGVVVVVLGVHDWDAFEAEFRDLLRLKVTTRRDSPVQASEPTVQQSTLRVLSIQPTGGHTCAVDFRAEVINDGSRFRRAAVSAAVGDEAVPVQPAVVDLIPNQPPEGVRILVPRPRLGELVHAFNHETTLYGRTLRVIVEADGDRAEEEWSEHVYAPGENSVRAEIQQREWRIGRGDATEADHRADAQSALLRSADERLDGERGG